MAVTDVLGSHLTRAEAVFIGSSGYYDEVLTRCEPIRPTVQD